jgi:hypothetical protein
MTRDALFRPTNTTVGGRMTRYALCTAGGHGEHMSGDIVNTWMPF